MRLQFDGVSFAVITANEDTVCIHCLVRQRIEKSLDLLLPCAIKK